MSLYSKKLHIKKPNGVVQIANLYTDKSDVGNNYLTFRDGSNTIYSVLDVNGDIDCKISKNNISYKIRNTNTIPKVRNAYQVNNIYSITFPKGVKKISVSTDVSPDMDIVISVTPEKPYRFMSRYLYLEPYDDDPNTEYSGYVIDELDYNVGGTLIYDCNGTYYITYSEEINNYSSDSSW